MRARVRGVCLSMCHLSQVCVCQLNVRAVFFFFTLIVLFLYDSFVFCVVCFPSPRFSRAPCLRSLLFFKPNIRTLEKMSTRLLLHSPCFLPGLFRLRCVVGLWACCSRACRFCRIKPLAMAAAMSPPSTSPSPPCLLTHSSPVSPPQNVPRRLPLCLSLLTRVREMRRGREAKRRKTTPFSKKAVVKEPWFFFYVWRAPVRHVSPVCAATVSTSSSSHRGPLSSDPNTTRGKITSPPFFFFFF